MSEAGTPVPPRPILRGERLYLQPVERDTLPASVEWFSDPEFAEGYDRRAPLTLVAAARWLEESHEGQGNERIGFRHEVRYRQAHFRHGRHHGVYYMSMLADEWAGQERPRTFELD